MSTKKEFFNQIHRQIFLRSGGNSSTHPRELNSWAQRVKTDLEDIIWYINGISYNIFRALPHGDRFPYDPLEFGLTGNSIICNAEPDFGDGVSIFSCFEICEEMYCALSCLILIILGNLDN